MKKTFSLLAGLLLTCLAFAQKNTLFSDDFSSNYNSWHEVDLTTTSISLERGVYYFKNNQAPFYHSWRTFDDFPYASWECTTDAKHITGVDTYGYGLHFGGADADNAFLFLISSNGYFIIGKLEAGSWYSIIDWTASPAIRQGNGSRNRLTVKQRNSSWEFFINDAFVQATSAQSLYGYGFGLAVENFQAIEFDNFSVSEGASGLAQPAPPVDPGISSSDINGQFNRLLADYPNGFANLVGEMLYTEDGDPTSDYASSVNLPGFNESFFNFGDGDLIPTFVGFYDYSTDINAAYKRYEELVRMVDGLSLSCCNLLGEEVSLEYSTDNLPYIHYWTIRPGTLSSSSPYSDLLLSATIEKVQDYDLLGILTTYYDVVLYVSYDY